MDDYGIRARRQMQKDDRRLERIFAGIVIGCVGTILIGLLVTVPWLGVPVTILAVLFFGLGSTPAPKRRGWKSPPVWIVILAAFDRSHQVVA